MLILIIAPGSIHQQFIFLKKPTWFPKTVFINLRVIQYGYKKSLTDLFLSSRGYKMVINYRDASRYRNAELILLHKQKNSDFWLPVSYIIFFFKILHIPTEAWNNVKALNIDSICKWRECLRILEYKKQNKIKLYTVDSKTMIAKTGLELFAQREFIYY